MGILLGSLCFVDKLRVGVGLIRIREDPSVVVVEGNVDSSDVIPPALEITGGVVVPLVVVVELLEEGDNGLSVKTRKESKINVTLLSRLVTVRLCCPLNKIGDL